MNEQVIVLYHIKENFIMENRSKLVRDISNWKKTRNPQTGSLEPEPDLEISKFGYTEWEQEAIHKEKGEQDIINKITSNPEILREKITKPYRISNMSPVLSCD